MRTPTVVTTEALRRFGELYAIEAEIRGSPAAERLAVRREKSVPLMASLANWWREQTAVMSSASGLKGAFTYLENNWDALNEFLAAHQSFSCINCWYSSAKSWASVRTLPSVITPPDNTLSAATSWFDVGQSGLVVRLMLCKLGQLRMCLL
ncbi:TPA: transposase [Salmonella enterica subsp. houtenae]|nr:transposase [Salmonella enterica subsp. houtenae]HAU3065589.1 transposase [Salmonella enterica subsp. houtenae]